jgi:penicillin amidase
MSWRNRALLIAGAVLPAAVSCAAIRERKALPRINGELILAGLEHEVRVDHDQWGVPHIQANSLRDALFAQGFVTARDRMIQLELFRRMGEGRLAEVAGEKALSVDTFMRCLGLRQTVSEIARLLPDDSREYLEDYSAGVNAYVDGTGKPFPLELMFLAGGHPRTWTLEDSLLALLFFNWTMDATWMADLMRGRLILRLGKAEAEMLLPTKRPGDIPVVRYGKGKRKTAADPPQDCELDFFPWDEDEPPWMVRRVMVHAQGSNNWVVDGSRTASGKPILCNDPHIQHTVPTLFYLCHLRSSEPACDVIGAALPGIPGVLMGRNERIAWGATSLVPDVADLFIETFADGESLRYRSGDGWEEAQSREEEIKVFPAKVVKRRVITTRHGPVIARVGNKALALKWVGHDPRNDSAGCYVRMGMAESWDEFTRGFEGYSGPALNLVYADRDGNIGYAAAGRIPLREGHDGSVPLAGEDERSNWKGYIPSSELPRELNPENGWIATANNKVVDEGFPHVITSMWEPSCRQERIVSLLEEGEKMDMGYMREMQNDVFSARGLFFRQQLLRACEGREDLSPQAVEALRFLSAWDGRASRESVAQSLYFASWKILTERLLRHRLGHRMYFEYVTSFFNVNQAVEEILNAQREEWLPASASSFDELLRQCLEEAAVRLQARFRSEDVGEWKWGRLHSLEIPHFLAANRLLARIFNLGPVPMNGDGETVRSAMPESDPTVQLLARSSLGGASDLPFLPRFFSDRVYAGAVFRMIVDLSDRGRSLWCLDTGQSAYRLSPFYRNFFPLWRKGEYVHMAYGEDEVKDATRSTLVLKPRS